MYWSYRWAKFVSSSSRSNNASTLIVLDAMSSTTLLQTVIEKLLAWYSQGRNKTNASRSNNALTQIVLTPILWCHVFNNVARAVVGMIESKSWQDEPVKDKHFLNTDCARSHLVVPPRLQQQHYEQCSNSCSMIEPRLWQDKLTNGKQFFNIDCCCSHLVTPRHHRRHYEQCSSVCC